METSRRENSVETPARAAGTLCSVTKDLSPMLRALLGSNPNSPEPDLHLAMIYVVGGCRAHRTADGGVDDVYDLVRQLTFMYLKMHPDTKPLSDELMLHFEAAQKGQTVDPDNLARLAKDLLGFNPFALDPDTMTHDESDQVERHVIESVRKRHPEFRGNAGEAQGAELFHMLATDPATCLRAFHEGGLLDKKAWTMTASVRKMATFFLEPPRDVDAARDECAALLCNLVRQGPSTADGQASMARKPEFAILLEPAADARGVVERAKARILEMEREIVYPLAGIAASGTEPTLEELMEDIKNNPGARRGLSDMLKKMKSSPEGAAFMDAAKAKAEAGEECVVS